MLIKGKIISSEAGKATVEISREIACSACSGRKSCPETGISGNKLRFMVNTDGRTLNSGDDVILRVETTLNPYLGLSIIFLVPSVFLAAGIFLANYRGYSEKIQFAAGIVFMLAGLVPAVFLEKHTKKHGITKVELAENENDKNC